MESSWDARLGGHRASGVCALNITPPARQQARAAPHERARPVVAYCRVVIQFLVIWSGQLVSQTGTAMTAFALLVWAYQETGRATSVALLGAAWFVPFVLVSPFAGVWVDRLDRRRVMLWADVAAGGITLGLLLLYWSGRLQLWHLYAAEAVAGAAQAFQIPAFLAATTVLVPPRHYARANGLRSVASLGADALAPLAAGAMLVWVGLAGVMLIDVATCAVAVITLAAVRVPRPVRADGAAEAREGFRSELAQGARYILARPGLMGLMAIFLGINFAGTLTYYAILPPMVLARTGNDTLALASVQSANGAAGALGGAIMAVWGGPRRKIHGVLAGAALSFLTGDLLLAVGRSVPIWVLSAAIGTTLIPVITACNQAIWQLRVEPSIQGRVFALASAVRTSTMPLGYLVGGLLADHWFEPAMAEGGRLAPWLGGLVGTGPGAGMAAMFLTTAILGTALSLSGYLFPAVRNVETERS